MRKKEEILKQLNYLEESDRNFNHQLAILIEVQVDRRDIEAEILEMLKKGKIIDLGGE